MSDQGLPPPPQGPSGQPGRPAPPPGYGYGYGGAPVGPQPESYLVWSILCTVFYVVVLIAAINSSSSSGDVDDF